MTRVRRSASVWKQAQEADAVSHDGVVVTVTHTLYYHDIGIHIIPQVLWEFGARAAPFAGMRPIRVAHEIAYNNLRGCLGCLHTKRKTKQISLHNTRVL